MVTQPVDLQVIQEVHKRFPAWIMVLFKPVERLHINYMITICTNFSYIVRTDIILESIEDIWIRYNDILRINIILETIQCCNKKTDYLLEKIIIRKTKIKNKILIQLLRIETKLRI